MRSMQTTVQLCGLLCVECFPQAQSTLSSNFLFPMAVISLFAVLRQILALVRGATSAPGLPEPLATPIPPQRRGGGGCGALEIRAPGWKVHGAHTSPRGPVPGLGNDQGITGAL